MVKTDQVPIFVLGITPRSRTNFLHRLLCQHPDVGSFTQTAAKEDFLVHHAHHLQEYIQKVAWQWAHWGDESDLAASLTKSLGKGIQHFLASHVEKRFIALKTPSVRGIGRFFDLFPKAYLIVIVRDGRSVVASGMSGFDWDFEAAARYWGQAARTISSFQSSTPSDTFHLVRYEDLNQHTVKELTSIFKYLDLDPEAYDFEEALNLPVYGSSFTGDDERGVDWSTVEKSDDFSANRRWDDWDRTRHERFNWLAGAELKTFAYELQFSQPASTGASLYHGALDLAHRARSAPRRLYHAARQGARTARRRWRVTIDTHLR